MPEQSTRKQHDYLVGLARKRKLTVPSRAETEHMSWAEIQRAIDSLNRGLDYFKVQRAPETPFSGLIK